MKKITAFVLGLILCIGIEPTTIYARADSKEQKNGEVKIEAPSAILMEASTGKIIYEKDVDHKCPLQA